MESLPTKSHSALDAESLPTKSHSVLDAESLPTKSHSVPDTESIYALDADPDEIGIQDDKRKLSF